MSLDAPRDRHADADWMHQAACRDQPPAWFTEPRSPDEARKALDVCGRCPVTRACLQTALTHPADADIGIWGATTEADRRALRHSGASLDDSLDEPPRRGRQPRQPTDVAERDARGTGDRSTTRGMLRSPEVTLGRDQNGDYTDATGRVIAFRIHGDPPYMLMVDGRPVARTSTLTEARQRAWTTLNRPRVPRAPDDPPRRPSHELPSRGGRS